MADIKDRIIRIQKALGVNADGIVGPDTLTAAETALGISMVGAPKRPGRVPAPTRDALHSLAPSVKGLEMIISFEVTSERHYARALSKPTWPKGQSGVTIGIGYDLGYNSAKQIEADWGGRIADAFVQDLKGVAGLHGTPARNAARRLARTGIRIRWETARSVFYERTLARFAEDTRDAYEGVDALPHDAQAAMLSLVYNRGTKKKRQPTSGDARSRAGYSPR